MTRLSVGRLPRGGQCGEIPKISFPEASTNKIALERLTGDIVHVLWHAPVRAFPASALGEEGVMLRVRTTEDAALQTFWSIIHGTPCALHHQSVTSVSQEGFLGLKTFFLKKNFSLKNCCLQTTYIELLNTVENTAFANLLPV